MRIAMVPGLVHPRGVGAPGGQNGCVAALSARLAARGHDVTVYTRRDDPVRPERMCLPEGYRLVSVSAGPARSVDVTELSRWLGKFGRFLADEWARDKPDVVHTHFWLTGLAAALAARTVPVPLVHTFHDFGAARRRYPREPDPGPAHRAPVERLLARTADRAHATSSAGLGELLRMGVSRERAAIVPRGVDTGLFTPDGPPADRPATGHRVVAVGRLLPRKGFELLISALRGLADTELLIVGGPDKAELDADPEAVRLLAHAERAGVADRVRLFGRVTHADLPALLRSADVVACAPWCEPFGMAAVEAMACGVPVVATSVGGLTDSVVDGVTGVLVPPGSPTALSHAIRRLLADGNRRAALAAAGRDRACSRYCWAQVTEETTREYERATGVARTHAVEPEEKQVSTGWPGETQG